MDSTWPITFTLKIHFHVKQCSISQKNQKEKKDFILNVLDEASLRLLLCLIVKPFDHILDFTYWIYAGSLSSPLTNFITFQTMFLCHKTEYPDELSFQIKQQHTNR